MEKKKLIGTIIGVIMFAVLIAGATYAWLTVGAAVNNGTYSASSKNFVVNYKSGTAVTSLNQLKAGTDPYTAITEGNGLIKVSAYKAAGSANGQLHINFNLDSTADEGLISDKVVKYQVCTSAACSGNIVEKGSIGAGKTILYEGPVPASETYYYIYMWLDAATINNNHLNKKFAGYVDADATQNDT